MGCGSKKFIRQLQKIGWSANRIRGIDGNANPAAGIDYGNFGAEAMPYEDGAFDIVTAWEVFEHLENPYAAMRDVKRMLAPGGYLLFSVPNLAHIQSRWQMMLHGRLARWSATNDHIAVLTQEIVEKTFTKELQFISIEYAAPGVALKKYGRFLRPFLRRYRRKPTNRLFGMFTLYVFKNSLQES